MFIEVILVSKKKFTESKISQIYFSFYIQFLPKSITFEGMLEAQNLEKICHSSITIVKEAGRFISSQIGKVTAVDIIAKEKNSLVSYVDIETEKILVNGLKDLVPNANFITEENTVTKTQQQSDWNWIIDPLDGTTNFLKGIPVFCISVGLSYKDEVCLGIIYDMNRDECFYAWKGGGAFLNDQKIKVSQVSQIEESVVATGFPYSNLQEGLIDLLDQILQKARGVRRLGSAALDLAYTACGRFDSYYELRINAWDIAAGIILVQEAGGRVSDIHGNANPLYSANILSSNGITHDEFLKLIENVKKF